MFGLRAKRSVVAVVIAVILSIALHLLVIVGPVIYEWISDSLQNDDLAQSVARKKISHITRVTLQSTPKANDTEKKIVSLPHGTLVINKKTKVLTPLEFTKKSQIHTKNLSTKVKVKKTNQTVAVKKIIKEPKQALVKKESDTTEDMSNPVINDVSKEVPLEDLVSINLPEKEKDADKGQSIEQNLETNTHPFSGNNANEMEDIQSSNNKQINNQKTDGSESEKNNNDAGEADPMLKVFPVDARAIYQAKMKGLSIKTQQHWQYKGGEYRIETTGKKFGYRVKFLSTGTITPNKGLSLTSYTELLDDKLHRMIEVSPGQVTFGRPDRPKEEKINEAVLDINSLIYQLGLMTDGRSNIVTDVIVNTNRYKMIFTPVAEEQLKMPGVGKVQALLIRGETVGGGDATAQVWLAPQYANYPLQIILTRKGDKVTLRLLSLKVGSQQLLGSSAVSMEDTSGSPVEMADF